MKHSFLLAPLLFTGITALGQVATDSSKPKELSEIVITSRYYRTYNTNNISSALRLKTPLTLLSQNIQTINADVIRDQASFNTTDAVTRNVSGLVRQEVSNNLGPYIFMRGGQISALRNGMDLTPIYRGPMPDDAAIIDRVEFVKGPSLFMNNIGDPAGSYNILTKQPTGKTGYRFNAMIGSWDLYRLAADLEGNLDRNQRLQYRLNVMGMKSRSFVQYDDNNRLLIAPVLKYHLNNHSFLSAEYIYQQFDYAMQSPIVMTPNGFGSLPRNFSIHEPSLTKYRPTDHNAFISYNNQLSKSWSVTARVSYLLNNSEGTYMWVTGVNAADPQVLLRNPKYDLTRYLVYSQQAFVNGSFTTGTIKHNFLGGIDLNQKKFDADSYVEYDKSAGGSLHYYPLSINKPGYGAEVPNYHTPGGVKNGNTYQQAHYESAYVLDELLLLHEKLRLTAGFRATQLKTYNTVSGAITSTTDLAFTPRVGINYAFTKDFTVYALYDNTFQPQTGVKGIATNTGGTPGYTAGGAVDPLKGLLWEAGIKKDWMQGHWNTTLSVYSIKRSNISEAIPSTTFRSEVGNSTSKGIDFDVRGEIVPRLNVIINYAWNDSKVSESITPALTGARTPMYVKTIQNTWLTYTFPRKILPGIGISAGYQYMGGRGERYTTATPKEVPDYFRLDAGINWRYKNWGVNLLVNNLTDKNAIATPWFRNGLYYWVPNAPRSFRLSMSYEL